MKVLVTGAAGFIGSHVVERLLARADSVLGVDNFDPFYAREEKEANVAPLRKEQGRFELLEVDITDPVKLRALLAGRAFDVVVHLAAKAGVRPSISDPAGYSLTNVTGTQIVLDVARELGVRRIVFGSSSSVYGNSSRVPFVESEPAVEPVSPYAATKRAGELLCYSHQQLVGGSIICLRFFTVYGPRQRPDLAIRKFSTLMMQGRPIPLFGDGTTERDYTWIDDIVDGVVAAIDRTGERPGEFEVINLGNRRAVSLRRLVDLLADSLGLVPDLQWLPLQPGDVTKTCADTSKARRLLGYQPRVAIEEGIPVFAEWLKGAVARGPTATATQIRT